MKFKQRIHVRRRTPGFFWIFRAAGVLIVLVGVYMAGGDELTCTGVSPAAGGVERGAADVERNATDAVVAACTLLTRKWLGQRVVDEAEYGGVTGADYLAVRRVGPNAEGSDHYVRLLNGDREVGRVFGQREAAQTAADRLRTWFEGGMRGEGRVVLSSWPFGYAAMTFGSVWLFLFRLMSRRFPVEGF